VTKQRETYNQKRNAEARQNPYDESPGDWHLRCWHCDWHYNYKGTSQEQRTEAAVQHRLNECAGWHFKKWQDEPDAAQQRDVRMEQIDFPQGRKQAIVHRLGDMALQIAGSYVLPKLG